jgi:hypothetical protein
MNRTLQDRLVKELRLAGIDGMEAGNAFLPGFMEHYNARFAVAPARPDDLHRPMNLAADRLKEILCKREQRYVGSQLTFSFERQRIMLEETDVTRVWLVAMSRPMPMPMVDWMCGGKAIACPTGCSIRTSG